MSLYLHLITQIISLRDNCFLYSYLKLAFSALMLLSNESVTYEMHIYNFISLWSWPEGCVQAYASINAFKRDKVRNVMWEGSRTNCKTGAADLGPAKEVEQAMGAGQLAAHQPFPFHHAAGLPAMQVVDGCHHHHVCARGRRKRGKQTETDVVQWSSWSARRNCKHFSKT